jgi:hypothetical protein
LVDSPHYRKDAFCAGLELLGYTISNHPTYGPDDLIVCWNRYARDEGIIRRYEAVGADVFITENAWLGSENKEPPDQHLFALSRNHHNGAGQWYIGDKPRWHPECKPWRRDGSKIVILPQRGMGEPGVRQEKNWLHDTSLQLRFKTCRPVETRSHPGIRPHPEIDWSDVWACVTWASGAAIKAIVAGVPVFYTFPKWIGAPAARFGIDDLEAPFLKDRSRMLHNLSWAMWSADEIASGEPFMWNIKLGQDGWSPPQSEISWATESRSVAS